MFVCVCVLLVCVVGVCIVRVCVVRVCCACMCECDLFAKKISLTVWKLKLVAISFIIMVLQYVAVHDK